MFDTAGLLLYASKVSIYSELHLFVDVDADKKCRVNRCISLIPSGNLDVNVQGLPESLQSLVLSVSDDYKLSRVTIDVDLSP